MIVVMRRGASEQEIEQVVTVLHEQRLTPHISSGSERTVVGVLGQVGPSGVTQALGSITPELGEKLESMEGVEQVLKVSKPYKLASR
ncbi:MAG: 3-deoxy-7-phosphoheptulonate synthase, partial [Ktedonobacterales bacterium]